MKPITQKLCVFMAMLCTLISASAYDFEVDGIYYDISSEADKEVSVTNDFGIPSYSGVVNIPAFVKYNGNVYKVTSVEDSAFEGCKNLTSISLPESIVSLGVRAFTDCSELTSISLPESIVSLGDYVFFECSKLTSIELPKSVISLGVFAFWGCSSLKNVKLSPSLKEIPEGCFYYCPFNKLDLPNGIERIGKRAFSDLTEQTTLILPPSINAIGLDAFPDNVNLIILNGNISWEISSIINSTLYILDDTYPTFDTEWPGKNIYVINKESFINQCLVLKKVDS